MNKIRIVIAGGGFAGLYAAKYLDKHLAARPDVEVTLIARENFILFTPMLHEVAAGDLAPADIVNPLRRILRHVQVIEVDVEAVDLSARKIRCAHGLDRAELEFEFDHLLLALGSETNFFDNAGLPIVTGRATRGAGVPTPGSMGKTRTPPDRFRGPNFF